MLVARPGGRRHAPLRLSLSGLQSGVYPDSPYCGTRKGRHRLPALRQQPSGAKGGGVFRRNVKEKLARLHRRASLPFAHPRVYLRLMFLPAHSENALFPLVLSSSEDKNRVAARCTVDFGETEDGLP